MMVIVHTQHPEVSDFKDLDLISGKEKGAFVSAAAASSCGKN